MLGLTSDSIDEVDFRVVQEEGGKTGSLVFSPGDSLTLSLKNTTDFEVGINLSCSTLEKKGADGTWEGVETNRACALYLVQLLAGEKHTKVVTLPTDDELKDGRRDEGVYRYVTDVRDLSVEDERVEQGVIVPTQPFEVRR